MNLLLENLVSVVVSQLIRSLLAQISVDSGFDEDILVLCGIWFGISLECNFSQFLKIVFFDFTVLIVLLSFLKEVFFFEIFHANDFDVFLIRSF
mgnify:CR=1 FL=1|jgi:hypothetical protein